MRERSAVLFMIVLLLALTWTFGCSSSDDNPTDSNNPPNSNQGQLTDLNFLFVNDAIGESSVGSYEIDFNVSFALLQGLTVTKAVPPIRDRLSTVLSPEDFEVVINVSNDPTQSGEGWYVFNFTGKLIDNLDTTNITGSDSVRILLAGTPVPWEADSTQLDQLQANMHVEWQSNSGEHGAAHHWLDVLVDIQSADSLARVNAAVNDTIEGIDETNSVICNYTVAHNSEVDSLVVQAKDNSDECPRAGVITAMASVALDCQSEGGLDSINVSGTWLLNATVNPDSTVIFSYTHGNLTWTDTVDCDDL